MYVCIHIDALVLPNFYLHKQWSIKKRNGKVKLRCKVWMKIGNIYLKAIIPQEVFCFVLCFFNPSCFMVK